MKLRTLIESKTSLESLSKGSLPINISWELKKFIKSVNPELIIFEELKNEKIIELGEEYVDPVDNLKKSKVKDKNMKKYTELMDELLDKDITVSVPQIKIKDLVDYKNANGKGIEINTGDLILLDWLIIE